MSARLNLATCRLHEGVAQLRADGTFRKHGCAGDGLTPSQAETRARTFHDWDSAYLDGGRDGDDHRWQRTVEIVDNGDSVGLRSKVTVHSGPSLSWDVADVDVRIAPADLRRFIAELTAIADARGLS